MKIPPDVKHWHGAAKDSWFVHLSIETNSSMGPAQWLEPVTDEEYEKLERGGKVDAAHRNYDASGVG